MFDIHCHIMPDVDDGSGNMSDSVEMAQIAAASGVRGIIATPHCNIPGSFQNYWKSEFDEKLKKLQETLEKKSVPVTVYPGQEIFLVKGFMSRLKNGELISLNGSRYLLVEFDVQSDSTSALLKLNQLTAEGYVPIVAHPERYGFVIENINVINQIRSSGCLIQLNRGSLKGDFGSHAKRAAQAILKSRKADFVASDAHSQYSRTPFLADTHEMISEFYSEDYADLLLNINPEKVLKDQTIY